MAGICKAVLIQALEIGPEAFCVLTSNRRNKDFQAFARCRMFAILGAYADNLLSPF